MLPLLCCCCVLLLLLCGFLGAVSSGVEWHEGAGEEVRRAVLAGEMLGARVNCARLLVRRVYVNRRYCSNSLRSSEDIEHYFPTLKRMELCGSSVYVIKFPDFKAVSGEAAKILRLMDKYEPLSDMTHPQRMSSFYGGRIALRKALSEVTTISIPSITRTTRGAPLLPEEVMGSISHKDNVAIACAMKRPSENCKSNTNSMKSGYLGIDIERSFFHRPSTTVKKFADKILTEKEVDSIGFLKDISLNEEVMLRFSLKEAVYKSLEPILGRYISYHEVEVYPVSDGTASIVNKLAKPSKQFRSIAQWSRLDSSFDERKKSEAKDEKSYWISCVHSYDFD